jgi:hypothetical protein
MLTSLAIKESLKAWRKQYGFLYSTAGMDMEIGEIKNDFFVMM